MRRYERLLSIVLFLALVGSPNAEYWFQSGVRGGPSSAGNNGASVQIQTVTSQSFASGSMAFWTGESLQNGAFIQAGYVVENLTGSYPTNCTLGGCSARTLLTVGRPTWFYEYFPPGQNGTFLGGLGPDGAAGTNGTFNTYGFRYSNGLWYFLFNNNTVGTVNLGASSSGINRPLAIGELANTSNAKGRMLPVIFSNLSFYKSGSLFPVSSAYGTIGYGVGSRTDLKNPYGVQEIGNRVNYFQIGSGLTQSTNNSQLWSLGYRLTVVSSYANLSSRNVYTAYSTVSISAPSIVYINSTARALFLGWSGSGIGSYTGTGNSAPITLNGNVTETANWQLQYYVNATSSFGSATGSGWYNSGSTARYALNASTIYVNGTPRLVFTGWSNGNLGLNGTLTVNSPQQLTAQWRFRVSLLAENAYGQPINTSYFLLDGYQTNGTAYIAINSSPSIHGALYKGVTFTVNTQPITLKTPATLVVPLPVYNVSIKTADLFGQPVNAMAIVQFKNGTQIVTYSGPSGFVNFTNVPFGYVSAVLQYLGAKNAAVTGYGKQVNVVFLTVPGIAVLAVVALVIIALAIRHVLRSRTRPQDKV